MRFLPLFLFLLLALVIENSCDSGVKKSISLEERLATSYCSSCHLFTPPSLLDKASWQRVLPIMKEKIELTGKVLPKDDWNNIYHYYYNNAPFNLTRNIVDTNKMEKVSLSIIDTFSTQLISPLIISITENESGDLLFGDLSGKISTVNRDGSKNKSVVTNSIPIQVQPINESSNLVLNMGELGPSHNANGSLLKLDDGEKTVLIDSLHRPIHFSPSDLDEDGNIEYIISHFGSTNDDKETGGLWLYEKDGQAFSSLQIGSYTGASKSIVLDLNKDGRDDIIALFAQGDERIIFFKNEGNMNFTEKVLLRFHPLYGSLDFILQDLNLDGNEEIILVNGDNADYSPVFKPYHGLRIFEQIDGIEFQEVVFHPINGAAKILLTQNRNKVVLGIFSLFPNLYSRPWEILSFIEVDSDFDTKRYYTEDVAGDHWVIASVDEMGNILLGKNLNIEKNIPSMRNDPMHQISAIKFSWKMIK